MSQRLLAFSGIGKRYGSKRILDGLSLALAAGNVAVTGANGAGKSTLLKVLAGAVAPDSGRIVIDGIDLAEHPTAAKRRFAYVPDKPMTYAFLRGHEFLGLIAELRGLDGGVEITDPLLARFRLRSHLSKRFDDMSLGTQRKFFLVAAFMADPQVLFMDEPTNGLDKHARQELIELLRNGRRRRLVLFASHDEDFMQRVRARRLHLAGNSIEPVVQDSERCDSIGQ